MKRKNVLTIHMLGEFSIENNVNRFPKDRKKSVQVMLLIAYLIANRNSMVTKAALIDVLWPQQDIDNPEGALRNLIYRARKEMSEFFPDQTKVRCILSKGNAYAWNSEVPQIIDEDDMQKLCERINAIENVEDIRMDAIQLCSRYSDSFMQEFQDIKWIEKERGKVQDTLLKTVEHACRLYMANEHYEYVIELCSYIDFKSFYNASIHECKLYSYYKLNQIAVALSYYHRVVDMYYSDMGMKPTAKMKEIYQLLSERSLQNAMDVNSLEDSLNEESFDNGAFYCDFDIFRNIYQINQRSAKRATRAHFLVLLTLANKGVPLTDKELQEEGEILSKVIGNDLRKNDVFSRCNAAQFAIIIATSKQEGCSKAIDRITSKYEMKKKHHNVAIQVEIRDIL